MWNQLFEIVFVLHLSGNTQTKKRQQKDAKEKPRYLSIDDSRFIEMLNNPGKAEKDYLERKKADAGFIQKISEAVNKTFKQMRQELSEV